MSTGPKNTIMKYKKVNGKRFQSSRKELKASKDKAITLERKMKRTRSWK